MIRRFGAPAQALPLLGRLQICPQLLQVPKALGLVRLLPLVDTPKPLPWIRPNSVVSRITVVSNTTSQKEYGRFEHEWMGIKRVNDQWLGLLPQQGACVRSLIGELRSHKSTQQKQKQKNGK